MKKAILIGVGVALLAWIGCGIFGGGSTPEDAAKNYIEKKFEAIGCDLSELKYTVAENKDNKATVKVSGTIKYDEEISLVKEDGKWMTSDAAKGVKKEKAATQKPKAEAPKKKASH